MFANQEKFYLQKILSHLDASNDSIILSRWFPLIEWLILLLYFLIVFKFRTELGYIAFGVLFLLAGIVWNAWSTYRLSTVQWKYIQPHLNRESIEKRLIDISQ